MSGSVAKEMRNVEKIFTRNVFNRMSFKIELNLEILILIFVLNEFFFKSMT